MKRRLAGAQILAAVIWLVMMLLVTVQVAVYDRAYAAGRNTKKGSSEEENEVEITENESSDYGDAKRTLLSVKTEKKETPQERKARLKDHSQVWLVVVSLVLVTAGIVKSNDYFYKKYKEKEEEKAKAKGRMI